jgi:hypothetical protein
MEIPYSELPCAGDVGLEDALADVGLDPAETHYRLARLAVSKLTCDFGFSDEDIAWAASLDPDAPLVVYAATGAYGVLDGRHRLWQALELGLAELDAFVLVEEPCFD